MRLSSGFVKVLLVVAIIGALNWGLIGFFNFNLVGAIFGPSGRTDASGLSRFIYAIVGLCGLISLFAIFRGPERTTATPVRRPGTVTP